MAQRIATIERKTLETQISIEMNLDGFGENKIATGIGFFDHMLTHFARHSMCDMDVTCRGDLEVDAHHTVEDVGIAIGQAIRSAVGEKAGIVRYGSSVIPMDDAPGDDGSRHQRQGRTGVRPGTEEGDARHVRHRTGCGVFQGAGDERRNHCSREATRREQRAPYSGGSVQVIRTRSQGGPFHRSQVSGCSLHQGDALERSEVGSRRSEGTDPRSGGFAIRPELGELARNEAFHNDRKVRGVFLWI